MSDELRKFTELDRVIHEPARLLIVTLLYTVEQVDFLYLLRETGLTKGNLSAHLGKLENAGYIQVEKTYRGKIPLTLIALTAEGRSAFETYRTQLAVVVSKLSEDKK